MSNSDKRQLVNDVRDLLLNRRAGTYRLKVTDLNPETGTKILKNEVLPKGATSDIIVEVIYNSEQIESNEQI